jgi:cytochrome P450
MTVALCPGAWARPRRRTGSGRFVMGRMTVAPSIYLMHRRPDIYPDPTRFAPERFLEERAGTYTWIPFGGGVRRCLGAAFAEYEMRVVLGLLFDSCTVARPVHGPVSHLAVRHLTVSAWPLYSIMTIIVDKAIIQRLRRRYRRKR